MSSVLKKADKLNLSLSLVKYKCDSKNLKGNFFKIENIGYREMNQLSFSDPQSRTKPCAYLLMIQPIETNHAQTVCIFHDIHCMSESHVFNDSSMEHNNITSSSITNKTELTTVR